MSFKEIFERIVEKYKGEKSGAGYQIFCPGHSDNARSASITYRENQAPLIHCFAGCEFDHLRKTLFLEGLWPNKSESGKKSREYQPPTATYIYTDAAGEELFQKCRYEKDENGKRKKWFIHQRRVGGKWIRKGVIISLQEEGRTAPLYNAAALAWKPFKQQQDVVLLCEGEKDADNLGALDGYVATTNHAGADNWDSGYNEALAGRVVIIMEDNDGAGRKRTRRLLSELRPVCKAVRVCRFPELPEKGDVSDYLAEYGLDALKAKLLEAQASQEETIEPAATKPWLAAGKDDRASAQDYYDFFAQLPTVKRVRKDILSTELMADIGDQWIFAAELEDYVKSHARGYGKFFNLTAFREHLERYRYDTAKPELLIDIPAWDGVDRIRAQADIFKFSNVTPDAYHELISYWGATIFRRLKDPTIQPFTIILQGDQGLGKDSLIDALTGELGLYVKNLRVDHNSPGEAEKQLHTALVFKIPEFDRTSKQDIATLKHLLTTSSTDVRLSYDRRDRKRMIRAAFVASCNIQDVLSDYTGARRFWVFNAEYLGLNTSLELDDAGPLEVVRQGYPGLWSNPNFREERLQILSQFKDLAERDYKPSVKSLRAMADFVRESSPDDPNQLMCDEFGAKVNALTDIPARRSTKDGAPLFLAAQIMPIVKDLAKEFGRSQQKVMQILGLYGFRERLKTTRFYRATKIGTYTVADDEIF